MWIYYLIQSKSLKSKKLKKKSVYTFMKISLSPAVSFIISFSFIRTFADHGYYVPVAMVGRK